MLIICSAGTLGLKGASEKFSFQLLDRVLPSQGLIQSDNCFLFALHSVAAKVQPVIILAKQWSGLGEFFNMPFLLMKWFPVSLGRYNCFIFLPREKSMHESLESPCQYQLTWRTPAAGVNSTVLYLWFTFTKMPTLDHHLINLSEQTLLIVADSQHFLKPWHFLPS